MDGDSEVRAHGQARSPGAADAATEGGGVAIADKKNVVAVLPDGHEHFGSVRSGSFELSDLRSLAERAVGAAGKTTKRASPESVPVKVYELEIRGGQMLRRRLSEYQVTPPFEPMTQAEYRAEMDEALKALPKEFRSWVESQAWDSGHAYGYEEVVNHARGLAYGLEMVVDEYTARLKSG